MAGEFGVAYLILGFVLQAIGYSLEISGVPSETGTDRLVVALAMTAIIAGMAWAAWALCHGPRIESLATAIAQERAVAAEEIDERTAAEESRNDGP